MKESVWLGLGDFAVLHQDNQEVQLAYMPRRVILPFGVRLERFQIDHYDGTRNPMQYSSQVNVMGGGADENNLITISMNEPLHAGGFTFYQSSYEEREPRPVTSIFSVNRDPGRELKYAGSLLIVLGSIHLFVNRALQKRKQRGKVV
jgi:cytochrome c biogenesis protein ResB